MTASRVLSLLLLAHAASCAAAPSQRPPWDRYSYLPSGYVSGILGVTDVDALELELSPSIGTTTENETLTLPLIAAHAQMPLKQDGLQWGYEMGFAFGWEGDRDAVIIDTGTVLVQADNDLWLLDLSGGLWVGTWIAERFRVYAGAGPLVQFGSVDLELDTPINGLNDLDESGIGYGYYSRIGVEVEIYPGTSAGFTARWVDSFVDLGGTMRDLDVEAIQFGFVVTSVM